MVITHSYQDILDIPEIRVSTLLRDFSLAKKLGGIEQWNANPMTFQELSSCGVSPEYIIDLFTKSHKVPDSLKQFFIQRTIMRLIPLLEEIVTETAGTNIQLRTFCKRDDVKMIFEAFSAAHTTKAWVAASYTASRAQNAFYLKHGSLGNEKYRQERDFQVCDIIFLTALGDEA